MSLNKTFDIFKNLRNLIINEEGIVRFQLEEIFVACEDFVTETKGGLELCLSLDKAP
jgi:hypothetical protein